MCASAATVVAVDVTSGREEAASRPPSSNRRIAGAARRETLAPFAGTCLKNPAACLSCRFCSFLFKRVGSLKACATPHISTQISHSTSLTSISLRLSDRHPERLLQLELLPRRLAPLGLLLLVIILGIGGARAR